jgi:hypothetical protein
LIIFTLFELGIQRTEFFINLMIFVRKIKHISLVTLLVIICFTKGFTQSIALKYSNEFLQIGVGAEALAKGNAVVAGVEGANSLYWNPSCLVNGSFKYDVSGMHSDYFAGLTKYDYLGFSTKLDDKNALGVSFIRFGVDNIPNTTQLIDKEGNFDFDRITLFSAADYAFNLSYAKKMNIPGLSFGGTAKIIHRKVGDMAKSWGFGIDLSLMYQKSDKLKIGILVRDATSTFNAWSYSLSQSVIDVFNSTGNTLPTNGLELSLPRIISGAQYKYPIGKKGNYLSGELDAEITTDGKRNTLISGNPFSINPKAGLEFCFRNYVFVRSGVQNFQYMLNASSNKTLTLQPSVGLGVAYQGIRLDYAFTNIGDFSTAMYSHIFSLRVMFNSFATD